MNHFLTFRAIEGDYVLGEQISLVDLHLGAWLARLFTILGYTASPGVGSQDSVLKLQERLQKVLKSIKTSTFDEKELGAVCESVEKYWGVLSKRKSFQEVYVDGLH